MRRWLRLVEVRKSESPKVRVTRSKGPRDQDISKSHSNTSLTLKKVHLVLHYFTNDDPQNPNDPSNDFTPPAVDGMGHLLISLFLHYLNGLINTWWCRMNYQTCKDKVFIWEIILTPDSFQLAVLPADNLLMWSHRWQD